VISARGAALVAALDLGVSIAVIGAHQAGWMGDQGLLVFINANLVCLAAAAFVAALSGVRGPSVAGPLSGRLLLVTVAALAVGELSLAVGEFSPSLGEAPERWAERVWIVSRLGAVGFVAAVARAQGPGPLVPRLAAVALVLPGAALLAWQAAGAAPGSPDLLLRVLLLSDVGAVTAVAGALAGRREARGAPGTLLLGGLGLYLVTDLLQYRSDALEMDFGFGELGYFAGLLAIAAGASRAPS